MTAWFMSTSTDETLRDYVKYLAAKYTAGTLEAAEIIELVDTFTDEGVWVDSFLDVMDSESKTKEALAPIFENCLLELGIGIPSQEQYLWQLICYHIKRIVMKKTTPLEGVAALKHDTWTDPSLLKVEKAVSKFSYTW